MNLRSKIIIGTAITCVILGLSLFALSKLLSVRVNAFVINLAEKMTQEIGHPVQIDSVATKWDWLLLKVNIKNLMILDQENGSPLFMASEIISTVDTLDSIRSFKLKFKQLLLQSPRLVMQWDGKSQPTILGLGQENVTSKIDPQAVLKILAMQRRILVVNGDLHLQGKDGADLPFMDIKLDFRQVDDQEYNMTARGNIAAAVQPEFIVAVRYYGDLADYMRAMLEFEIKTSNVQLAELFNFIPQFRQTIVQGHFSDFDLKGVVQNGTVRSVTSDFNINDISIDQDTHIISGAGHIEYKPGDNHSDLQLAHLTINNDKLYTQPLNVDAFSAALVYEQLEDGKVKIYMQNARLKLLEMDLHPEFTSLFEGNKLIDLRCNAKLDDVPIRRLLVLLPDKKLSVNFNEWLKRSITDGNIDQLDVQYAENKLLWSLNFTGAELKFSPDWPGVYGIDAKLVMDDGNLTIDASKAMILGNELRVLTTKYNEYEDNKQNAIVSISGNMDTTLEAALNYIQQTPLRDKIGNKLEPYNPQGAIGLDLQLNINIAQADLTIDVFGNIELRQAQARLADVDIPISNINGNLSFTNNAFSADKLQFTLLDQPATATVGMHPSKNNTLNLTVNGPIKISALKKILPRVNFDHINGISNVKAVIELPLAAEKQDKILTFSSDLQGVEITYPQPFAKQRNAKMPVQILYVMQDESQDNVKFKFGILDGILFLKNRKFQGGRIAVSHKLASNQITDNLIINGNIKKLDWADWAPFVNTNSQTDFRLEIDLLVDTLNLYGEEYKPMRIKYSSSKRELFLDSPILTGTIAINQEADVIAIKLDKLNVPEKRVKNNAMLDFLREKRKASQLPMIQFYCEKLQFNKRFFNKIALELLPRTYGYEITNFSITNDNLSLQAQGSWQMDNVSITTLSGNIHTQNWGKVMAEWGYPNSISRGKGELSFNVHWDGGPIDFDVLKLAGSSRLDMRSGSLTNVNPGIGRIIGLLSLESIQRRLQLDFSDILSKGFAFDKFLADIKLEPGLVLSDNIFINSPSAKIELSGKTGIKSRELDFTMFVTPKVGASLPIAAAIAAGNPAVGAAIWLFDKASGSKISEITKYKYRVTGTWEAPQVNEVANKNDEFKVMG